MKEFRIRQKFWSWGESFTILDQHGSLTYQVKGSVFKFFKEFTISDAQGTIVSQIKRNFSWFLPSYTVQLAGGQELVIQKEFTWFKDCYRIDNLGLEVLGDFLDMNFSMTYQGQEVARISQEWFRLTSTYLVQVYDESYTDLAISLVIAIDHIKAEEASRISGD